MNVKDLTVTFTIRGRKYTHKLEKDILFQDLNQNVKIITNKLREQVKYFHGKEASDDSQS